MLVLPTWFTEARAVTKSPTYTGARKDSSSTKAVTTRLRAWRVAAAPAHSSISLMISPPWTLPHGLASDGSMLRDMIVLEAETGFASGTRECYSRKDRRI